MFCSRSWFLGVAVLSLGSAASAAVITIDDFEDGYMNLAVDSGIDYSTTAPASLTSLAGVIGGQRNALLEYMVGPNYSRVFIDRANSGAFVLAEDPDTRARATLTYGAGGALNVDLAAQGPGSAIRFVFSTADLAGQLSIQASSVSPSRISTWTGSTPGGLFTTDMNFDVPLNDPGWFANSGGGVDWHDVDRITITLTGVPNGDYVIREIVTVPEPVSLLLLAMGSLPVIRRRNP